MACCKVEKRMKHLQFLNVSDVCINAGTLFASQELHHFFEKNNSFFQEKNIYYPINNASYALFGHRAQYNIVQSARYSLGAIREEFNDILSTIKWNRQSDSACTLILSCPLLYRWQDLIFFIESTLCEFCPNATIRYFASFPPQYLEIESYVGFASLWTSYTINDLIAIQHSVQLHYESLWQTFTQSHGDKVRAHMTCDGQTSLQAFLSFMGLSCSDLQRQGADFSPPPYRLECLPASFLTCSSYANGLPGYPSPPAGIAPWSTQAPYYMPENGVTPPSLLGPARRGKIHAFYEDSNNALADMLGCNDRFTPPPDEPEWRESAVVSSKTVSQVVQKLDEEFARSLLEDIASEARPRSYIHPLLHNALAARLNDREHTGPPYRVSVLTLTFRHVQYIQQCIDSVLAQKTTFPVQHILVDDGSDDATAEIIANYAGKYSHIRHIHIQRRKQGDNIRFLFAACDTQYAALCDGDDYFTDPLKLQKQVDFLDANPDCALCFHPVQVVYEDGTDRERIYPPLELLPRGVRPFYHMADLFKANFIQTNSVMYRWRFTDGLPDWFRVDLLPSDWYWHILHAEMGKIGFMPDVMSVYRRHAQSLYYSSENPETTVPHRILHGLNELKTYDAINHHFDRRYERSLIVFTNSVLSDFMKHAHATGDDSYLHQAGERFPNFMEYFLHYVKAAQAAAQTRPAE